MSTNTEAIIEDLYRVPDDGKAEIVNGELMLMSEAPVRAAAGDNISKVFGNKL